MRDHDINFYLSQRPPSFWAAVSIAAVIVALLVVLLVRTLARWALALPLVLFEGIVPRRALGESATRLTGRRSTTIAVLAVWAVVAAALLGLAASVPDFIGRGLAPRFSGSMETLLAFITGLVLLWVVLGLAAAVANVSMLSLVLLQLYLRVAEGREPGALRAPTFGTGESVVRLPRAVRIAAAIVSILAIFGGVLVVANAARQNQPVMVIAHRGASAAAPENTLAAFRLGAELGADFVELDVQESADGEVVVVHDSDLMKVGGSPLKIREAPAAALRAVDIGSRKGPQFSAERVPTLAEALEASKGRVRVVVELKSYGHSQRLEERVVEIVEAAGVADDTIFMSLDHDMIRRLKELRPSWRVGALVAKAIGDLTTLGADFLAVEASLATRAFVRRAHRAGQDVYVWTVNDPAWMLAAMAKSVDGLITDHPDIARQAVERRGQDERPAAHPGSAPRGDGREDPSRSSPRKPCCRTHSPHGPCCLLPPIGTALRPLGRSSLPPSARRPRPISFRAEPMVCTGGAAAAGRVEHGAGRRRHLVGAGRQRIRSPCEFSGFPAGVPSD